MTSTQRQKRADSRQSRLCRNTTLDRIFEFIESDDELESALRKYSNDVYANGKSLIGIYIIEDDTNFSALVVKDDRAYVISNSDGGLQKNTEDCIRNYVQIVKFSRCRPRKENKKYGLLLAMDSARIAYQHIVQYDADQATSKLVQELSNIDNPRQQEDYVVALRKFTLETMLLSEFSFKPAISNQQHDLRSRPKRSTNHVTEDEVDEHVESINREVTLRQEDIRILSGRSGGRVGITANDGRDFNCIATSSKTTEQTTNAESTTLTRARLRELNEEREELQIMADEFSSAESSQSFQITEDESNDLDTTDTETETDTVYASSQYSALSIDPRFGKNCPSENYKIHNRVWRNNWKTGLIRYLVKKNRRWMKGMKEWKDDGPDMRYKLPQGFWMKASRYLGFRKSPKQCSEYAFILSKIPMEDLIRKHGLKPKEAFLMSNLFSRNVKAKKLQVKPRSVRVQAAPGLRRKPWLVNEEIQILRYILRDTADTSTRRAHGQTSEFWSEFANHFNNERSGTAYRIRALSLSKLEPSVLKAKYKLGDKEIALLQGN